MRETEIANPTKKLPISLQQIVANLKEVKSAKPAQVRKIVLNAGVRADDLGKWADFDHPVSDSYGRKLVYKGDRFEIMVMSWRPGDFSTIHDHGHTQWGAVQIFGPAEHATFRIDEEALITTSRQVVNPGDAVGVSHTLIHQMGNPTSDKFFLSLHIYGTMQNMENVTSDARIFDLCNNTIQRVDGGVFFALPEKGIKSIESGPIGDFPTKLRHTLEMSRRLLKMEKAGIQHAIKSKEVITKLFSLAQREALLNHIRNLVNENDHVENSIQWKILNRELKALSYFQNQELGKVITSDKFYKYAELYDALISKPCLDQFMSRYINFFIEKHQTELPGQKIISLGCGTGLVEEYLIQYQGVPYHNLYGIDISESMIKEARKRIRADVGDITTLDPSIQMWDIAYSGLNVFLYLPHQKLEEAIKKTAAVVKSGGYFLGDFITPDHIRWYPNVMYSKNKNVISLRTPKLVEQTGRMFQESEITNINFLDDEMEVSYAGKHLRFLPPLHRVRAYFEKAFGGKVDLYDAYSLKPIPEWADSCSSTRYVVVAQKK